MKRLCFLSIFVVLLGIMAVPAMAQDDLFGDGRLDLKPDAPVVAYCNYRGGLDVFRALGGDAFSLSRVQVEGGLAQAVIDNTAIQIASGGGARLIAFPDGALLLTASYYTFTIPGTSCGGFQPDYGNAVINLVDAVEDILNISDVNGGTGGPTTANPYASAPDDRTIYVSQANVRTHTVQRGENLFRIGIRYGVPYTEIARVNGIGNVNSIYAGQILVIPEWRN